MKRGLTPTPFTLRIKPGTSPTPNSFNGRMKSRGSCSSAGLYFNCSYKGLFSGFKLI